MPELPKMPNLTLRAALPTNMQVAIDAGAADYVMPDVERIGGVTGWRQAAGIAADRN